MHICLSPNANVVMGQTLKNKQLSSSIGCLLWIHFPGMSIPPYDYSTIFRSNKTMTFDAPQSSLPDSIVYDIFKPPEKVIAPHQRTNEYQLIQLKYLDLLDSKKEGVKMELKPKKKEELIDQQAYKLAQKTLVAQALCDRSYGAESLQLLIINYKELIVNKSKYQIIAKAVVTEGVKKIEMFLVELCQMNLELTLSHELATIYNVLLNCKTKMKEEESQIFLNTIRALYGLKEYSLTQIEALKVLLAIRGHILEAANKKKEATKMQFKPQLQSRPVRMFRNRLFARAISSRGGKEQPHCDEGVSQEDDIVVGNVQELRITPNEEDDYYQNEEFSLEEDLLE